MTWCVYIECVCVHVRTCTMRIIVVRECACMHVCSSTCLVVYVHQSFKTVGWKVTPRQCLCMATTGESQVAMVLCRIMLQTIRWREFAYKPRSNVQVIMRGEKSRKGARGCITLLVWFSGHQQKCIAELAGKIMHSYEWPSALPNKARRTLEFSRPRLVFA